MSEITEKDKDLFVKILDRDKRTLHFLWDCAEGRVVTAGSSLFENVKGDPLDFLRDSGLIDEQYLPAFSVFAALLE